MSELQLLPTDPEQLMRAVTSAFAEGDMRPLFAAVHKEIIWKSASSHVNLFRFSGVRERRAGVVEVAGEIASEYIFRRLAPKEIVARGDVVWGLFDAEVKYQPVGNKRPYDNIQLDIAMRWHIKDGKIIEHQAFFDTAALLAQRGDIPRSTSP